MQSLWSRAARLPQSSTCRCVACLRTATEGVTSHTTSAASRRRLRIGNAVTAFYSSIFAGAALADAKVKEKRRLEWEEKIAAVKEEVDRLVDEENRLLQTLAFRHSEFLFGFPNQQRRQYSTSWAAPRWIGEARATSEAQNPSVAHPFNIDDKAQDRHSNLAEEVLTLKEDDRSIRTSAQQTLRQHFEQRQVTSAFHHENPVKSDTGYTDDDAESPLFDYASNALSDRAELPPRPQPDFIWETGDILRIKAIQKLALRQLAYRLLLRPAVARNYSGLPVDYEADLQSLRLGPQELLQYLQNTGKRLWALKFFKEEPYDDLAPAIDTAQHHLLRQASQTSDAQLKEDVEAYLHGRLHIQEFLARVARNLLLCGEPDRPRAFQALILAFTKTRQNDLIDLILKALIPHLFHLTTPLINSILTYYRKTRNLRDFDNFLMLLRGESAYHVNIPLLWEKRIINGVEITVPPAPSANPVLFSTLIAATLRFDQIDRAEAFLQVYRANGFADNFGTLCAFLRFYTLRRRWEEGLQTMLRSLAYMVSSTVHPEKRVERLIVHMVHFCDSCQQAQAAEMLINAAVRSGFDWRAGWRNQDVYSEFDPVLKRWQQAAKEMGEAHIAASQRSVSAKCQEFVHLVRDELTHAQTNLRNNTAHGKNASNDPAWLRNSLARDHSWAIFSTAMADAAAHKSVRALIKDAAAHNADEILTLREEMARLKKTVERLSKSTQATVSIVPPTAEETKPEIIPGSSSVKKLWTSSSLRSSS